MVSHHPPNRDASDQPSHHHLDGKLGRITPQPSPPPSLGPLHGCPTQPELLHATQSELLHATAAVSRRPRCCPDSQSCAACCLQCCSSRQPPVVTNPPSNTHFLSLRCISLSKYAIYTKAIKIRENKFGGLPIYFSETLFHLC